MLAIIGGTLRMRPMEFLGNHRLTVIGWTDNEQVARAYLAGLVGQ